MKMHNLYEENFAISLVYYKLQNVDQELFIAFHVPSYANHTKNQDFRTKVHDQGTKPLPKSCGFVWNCNSFFWTLAFSGWEDLQWVAKTQSQL